MKNFIKKAQAKRSDSKNYIEKKLIMRLRIFFVIITGLICLTAYNIISETLSIWLAMIALALGVIIGFIVGRMFKIFWHPETEKVVSRVDKLGGVFLVIYMIIELGRNIFFGYWLEGVQLQTFGFAFLTGILIGRLLSMMKSIKNILQVEKNIS